MISVNLCFRFLSENSLQKISHQIFKNMTSLKIMYASNCNNIKTIIFLLPILLYVFYVAIITHDY